MASIPSKTHKPGSTRRPATRHHAATRRGIYASAALAAILLISAGCTPPIKQYQSQFPPFQLQYPADWHLDVQGRATGQELLFVPRPEPREDDPRILLHLQRVDDMHDMLPGHYQVDLGVDPGWRGRRYIIFRSPLTPVVEVYATERQFEKTDLLAASLAAQLARQFPLPDDLIVTTPLTENVSPAPPARGALE